MGRLMDAFLTSRCSARIRQALIARLYIAACCWAATARWSVTYTVWVCSASATSVALPIARPPLPRRGHRRPGSRGWRGRPEYRPCHRTHGGAGTRGAALGDDLALYRGNPRSGRIETRSVGSPRCCTRSGHGPAARGTARAADRSRPWCSAVAEGQPAPGGRGRRGRRGRRRNATGEEEHARKGDDGGSFTERAGDHRRNFLIQQAHGCLEYVAYAVVVDGQREAPYPWILRAGASSTAGSACRYDGRSVPA